MKRARANSGGSVTGGTGDVKPQILTLSTALAGGLDDYVTIRAALPVSRFGTRKGVSTIFEILWADFYLGLANVGDVNTYEFGFISTNTGRADADTVTLTTAFEDISDPRTLAYASYQGILLTSGMSRNKFPIHFNLTDSNGNGVLVATDTLFFVGGGIGNAAASRYAVKIGYRLVNVGIEEYVGIVQSQS